MRNTDKPETPKNPEPLNGMPDDALKKYVFGIIEGRVYSLRWHLPTTGHEDSDARAAANVFMVLKLGGLAKLPKAQRSDIGDIYEFLDKAGPITVNGQPMFFSCRIMNRDDFKRATQAIEAERKRRAEVTL